MQGAPTDNLYAPPTAHVAPAPAVAGDAQPFYVVSATKFCVLFFVTFGMYVLYWFYAHWRHWRRVGGETIWPVARAVFSVFFAHALARRIDDRLRAIGIVRAWSPALAATVYVVFQIGSTVTSRMADREIGSPVTDVVSLLALVPIAWSMLAMQRAANAACGDPAGAGNRRFTWANWLWIALFGLLWLLIGVAIALSLFEMTMLL
ncbi:hypothetical protein [Luteimonas sp. FCS-9]|uniref:hypothetical protein n=1 Tax=Luteimonas sp. FCS-9 TaxID=1547516 RepID=UPI00063EB6BB|nr:hypothetical protein [Luteimonas sp. FCS-9]KLI99870.1 hypothetical protein WQ56_10745 [Luteimonas sp. FCS-9]